MARKVQTRKSPRKARELETLSAATGSATASRPRASAKRKSSSSSDMDFKDMVREFISSPAFKYAAGGIATALLTRLANNMSEKYPEISNFIRENLETMESKFSFGSDENVTH